MNKEGNNQDGTSSDKAGQTSKPDPGTLHNTDPQENMEGPVSSSMRRAGEQFDTNENRSRADEQRERNM